MIPVVEQGHVTGSEDQSLLLVDLRKKLHVWKIKDFSQEDKGFNYKYHWHLFDYDLRSWKISTTEWRTQSGRSDVIFWLFFQWSRISCMDELSSAACIVMHGGFPHCSQMPVLKIAFLLTSRLGTNTEMRLMNNANGRVETQLN